MQLKSLFIKNFKGIGEQGVTINFAPITMLFGPNNSGKSSIIQALHYAREVICSSDLSPNYIEGYGKTISLGGFQNFIHRHDLDREILFKFDMELDGITDYYMEIEGIYIDNGAFDTLFARVRSASIAIGIKWDFYDNQPIVNSYAIELNGKQFMTLTRSHKTLFNFSGCDPSMLLDSESLESLRNSIKVMNFSDGYFKESFYDVLNSITDSIPNVLMDYVDYERFLSSLGLDFEEFDSTYFDTLKTNTLILPFGDWDSYIEATDENWFGKVDDVTDHAYQGTEYVPNVPYSLLTQALLSSLMIGPTRELAKYFKIVHHIDPSRSVPERYFNAEALTSSDMQETTIAWKYLAMIPELMQDVNNELPRVLGVDFGLHMEHYAESSFDIHLFANKLEKAIVDGDDLRAGQIQNILRASGNGIRNHLVFIDKYKTALSPSDLGNGVSKIIPLITIPYITKYIKSLEGLICIEEPEANIHPAWQVELGEFFLRMATLEDDLSKPLLEFLIETHSEHIMLRLLRRIRETHEGDLPEGATSAEPEDVAVHYIQKNDGGCTEVVHLKITEDGDFEQHWPKGFFEEREEEIF